MRSTGCAILLACVLAAACAPAVKRTREARESATRLPPHGVEVDYGLWSCERGYVMKDGLCVPEDELPKGQQVEIYDPEAAALAASDDGPEPRPKGLPTAMPAFDWNEADFPPRPVAPLPFSTDPGNPSTVIGEPSPYTIPSGQTMYEAARHHGLGINQVAEAFPDVDLVKPPAGETFELPTWWVLPETSYRGLVINIPELRIYYFPAAAPGTVITYPVGLGRQGWRSPIAPFRVIEKTVDPVWIIPASIREEHIRERNDPRTMIAGGDPDNPLGRYRLRLNLPLYGIHGTNIPWGIGMEVTHGCVRLYPEDIERLFALVPVGTPGEFVYQPVKVGARGGDVYVEVHPDVYDTGFNYLQEALRLLAAKGWSKRVDFALLEQAIEGQRGTPTRISGPVTRQAERAAARPAS